MSILTSVDQFYRVAIKAAIFGRKEWQTRLGNGLSLGWFIGSFCCWLERAIGNGGPTHQNVTEQWRTILLEGNIWSMPLCFPFSSWFKECLMVATVNSSWDTFFTLALTVLVRHFLAQINVIRGWEEEDTIFPFAYTYLWVEMLHSWTECNRITVKNKIKLKIQIIF